MFERLAGPRGTRQAWTVSRRSSCAATAMPSRGADHRSRGRGCCRRFDTFLLAHATKHHLVEPRFYKRVYRNQGWLSPVVIVAGRIVAVWFLRAAGEDLYG